MNDHQAIIVGITGASGAGYARRLVQCLVAADRDVHLIVSPHGRQLLAEELDIRDPTPEALLGRASDRLTTTIQVS